VKQSLRERYKVLSPTPVGYTAQLGDVLHINMRGYEREDGSATPSNRVGFNRAKPLPAIASGDQVEVCAACCVVPTDDLMLLDGGVFIA
jgi:hypothetical protein